MSFKIRQNWLWYSLVGIAFLLPNLVLSVTIPGSWSFQSYQTNNSIVMPSPACIILFSIALFCLGVLLMMGILQHEKNVFLIITSVLCTVFIYVWQATWPIGSTASTQILLFPGLLCCILLCFAAAKVIITTANVSLMMAIFVTWWFVVVLAMSISAIASQQSSSVFNNTTVTQPITFSSDVTFSSDITVNGNFAFSSINPIPTFSTTTSSSSSSSSSSSTNHDHMDFHKGNEKRRISTSSTSLLTERSVAESAGTIGLDTCVDYTCSSTLSSTLVDSVILTDGVATLTNGILSHATLLNSTLVSLQQINATLVSADTITDNAGNTIANGFISTQAIASAFGFIICQLDVETSTCDDSPAGYFISYAPSQSNLFATTMTDGVLTLKGGTLTSARMLSTSTLSAQTMTDGVATLKSGSLTAARLLSSSTFTDGTASLAQGSLTNLNFQYADNFTDGYLSISVGNLVTSSSLGGLVLARQLHTWDCPGTISSMDISCGNINNANTITANDISAITFSDGTALLHHGSLTSATFADISTITDGTASLNQGNLTNLSFMSASTLSDGTGTFKQGLLTNMGVVASELLLFTDGLYNPGNTVQRGSYVDTFSTINYADYPLNPSECTNPAGINLHNFHPTYPASVIFTPTSNVPGIVEYIWIYRADYFGVAYQGCNLSNHIINSGGPITYYATMTVVETI